MPANRSAIPGSAKATTTAILIHVSIPYLLPVRDAVAREDPGQKSLVRKSRSPRNCKVGDRAEAGMSITPTPLVRRELLPFSLANSVATAGCQISQSLA